MSQTPTPTYPQFVHAVPSFVAAPPRRHNGLGIFGFLLAFVGLFVPTGIVSLLGLMLCLVAVGQAPRGLAAAGVVFGLIGSVFWLIVSIAVVLLGLVATMAAALVTAGAFVLVQPEVVEVTADMVNVTLAAAEWEEREDGRTPRLSELGLGVAATTDPWGHEYRLVPAERDPGFDVISAGRDGEFDTDDDVALSRLDRLWEEAVNDFEHTLDAFGDRFESMGGGTCVVRVHDGPHDRCVAGGPEAFYRAAAIREILRESSAR